MSERAAEYDTGERGLAGLVGGYCVVTGGVTAVLSLALGPVSPLLAPGWPWGAALVAAGAVLLSVAARRPCRPYSLLGYLLAAAALGGVAARLAAAGEAVGALGYGSLALALAGGALRRQGDLLALAMAATALGSGAATLLGIYRPPTALAPELVGGAWLVAGAVLLAAWRARSPGLAAAAHILAGGTWLGSGLLVDQLANRVLYGGWGLLLLARPARAALRRWLALPAARHRQAEALLRQQRDFMTAITDSLAEGVCAVDRAGRITFANPAAARLLGRSPAALLGEDLHRALHGAEHAACTLRQLLTAPDTPRQGEEVFRHTDGHVFAVGYSATPIRTGDVVTGIVLAFSDITARKQVEAELQASEQRLQLALAAGRMGTWEWDIGGERVHWSPSLEAIHGLAPGTFGGTVAAFLERVHPDDRPRLERAIQDLLREGDRYHVEYRAVQPGGRVIWLEGRGQLLRDARGRPLRLVGVATDITERKQTEEALGLLARSSALLTASLDYETTLVRVARTAVPDLADVCIVDLLEADGRIRRVAVAHADPAQEPLARALQRRWPPRPDGPNSVARVLRTGTSELTPEVDDARLQAIAQTPEHLAVLRALEPRSAMNVPLLARGRILGALTFLSTTSGRRFGPPELRLAEDIARRAALAVDNARLYREAREAIRLRDEFLALAAHELKTPLTSLRGFAQLKRRQLERLGHLPLDELRRALGVIDQQAERLARLVDRLLDISQLDAGQLQLAPQPVDLAALVQRAIAAARATTGQHTLVYDGPAQLWTVVDPTRIGQVVANVLDNAIQYSPAGGTIQVLLAERGEQVCLQVTDPGIGILPDERERVFERFYRGPEAGHLAGLGLGLHLARQLVELHGGTIAIETPPAGGTRVIVTLPVGQSAPLSSTAPRRD